MNTQRLQGTDPANAEHAILRHVSVTDIQPCGDLPINRLVVVAIRVEKAGG